MATINAVRRSPYSMGETSRQIGGRFRLFGRCVIGAKNASLSIVRESSSRDGAPWMRDNGDLGKIKDATRSICSPAVSA